MHLKSISLINFKNYAQAEFELNEGINCFVGKNGAGKTNVLDAVHYLSMCKSYLNPVDKQNIRFNEQFFVVQGTWQEEDKETEIYCGVKAGAKKIFKRNKAEYEKLADHIGSFPSVIISPYDRDLIAEGSEVRRRWMDGFYFWVLALKLVQFRAVQKMKRHQKRQIMAFHLKMEVCSFNLKRLC